MSIPEFNNEEIAQYSRHLILPEFNIEGQRKLKNSSVLVVGAGGLGCPLLQYLTAAGVGHLGIVDYDIVDQSNLQRQVLYSADDIGKSKAETAAKKLFRLNPHIRFSVINDQLTSRNALEIISKFDIVCDGTDNFPTRYLVNDACVILDKPNIHGAIFKFEGQVSVFNYKFENGDHGPQYRDIFPTPPPPGEVPSCAEGGVLGVLPGIVGSIQASETIKVIAGIGEPLAGKLFIFDALSFETRILKINKNPDLQIPEVLIDYDDFCGLNESPDRTVTEISVEELKSMIDKDKDFQLIDVRNQYEHNIASLEGLLIPLDDLDQRVSEIPTDKTTIFYCRSGIRSAKAIKKLQKLGFKNLFNLKGGIMEWAEKINPSLPRY
jgi:molybdopterin/thiamine biosynthesis adenylyltransferase/rhodanese-related sulfurtransferase